MENSTQSTFQKFNNWFKNSISIKLISIGFLILLLMIPTSMIESLIREREMTRNSVVNEINSKWGNRQTVAGPILTVPYRTYYKDSKEITRVTINYAHFLPDDLVINGEITPEIRYRGIYKVVVYNSLLNFSGNFSRPDFAEWGIGNQNVDWDDAYISIGIPDMRGIQENIIVNWSGKNLVVNPGITNNAVLSSGVSTKVPILSDDSLNTGYSFSFEINLNGSRELNFIPLGKETNVILISDWQHPSFAGSFLPDEREITEDGFSAHWKVLHLNRNYPQKWLGDGYDIGQSEFGVYLLFPVDQYQKSMRSAKYANMFLFLTFLIFFFVEIINKMRIHPLQYLLVGFAMCIFYSLLISLSEQMNFNYAYLIASVGIVTLITAYSRSIFKDFRLTLLMGMVLVALYIFLFTILQLQDYSLLLGSIGLFLVLGIVMYLSRKVEWYTSDPERESDKASLT